MKNTILALALAFAGAAILPGQVDVSTGDLQIIPEVNGQAVTSLGVGGYLRVYVDDVLTANFYMANPLTIPVLAGTRKVTIMSEWFEGAVTKNFTVAAGTTVAGNIELNSVFGLVHGVLTENGGPLPTQTYSVGPRVNVGPGPELPAGGFFRMVVPAGERGAVFYRNGALLLIRNYVAVAGQDVDMGTVDIAFGNLQISPIYNGQPVSGLGVGGYLRVYVDDQLTANWDMTNPLTIPVLAGNRKVTIMSEWYEGPVNAIIPVAGGATVPANIELNPVFGLVHGVLTENGGPLPFQAYNVAPRVNVNPGPVLPAGGFFRMLVPAGSRAAVILRNGSALTTRDYTATAGQDLDLGTIDIALGSLEIRPLYKGQAVTGLGVGGYLRVYLDDILTLNFYMPDTYPRTIPVLAGNRKITIMSEWFEGPVTAFFNASAGVPATANIELSSVFGLVRGVLTENGGPLPLQTFQVGPRLNVSPGPTLPAGGLFRMLVPAGSRTGVVYKNGAQIFTFPYTAIAGQEVDLGSPGSMSFLGTIARTGTQASRTWNISLKNLASVAFLGTTAQLILTQVPGTTACTPTISAPNPVTYGDFAAGATITKPFVIDFTGCPTTPAASAAKFKVELQITSGASTTRMTIAPVGAM